MGRPMLYTVPSTAAAAAPPARAAAARLLLFVGTALRPDSALTDALARDGVRCLWLGSIDAAQRAAQLAVFDGVIVDGALVDADAGRAIAALRDALAAPLLVVGRCVDEIDEVIALESGADAWLAPPLAPRRLRAHVDALLRRPPRAPDPQKPQLPPGWHLDAAAQRLVRGSHEVTLSEAQTRLLQCLLGTAGAPVSRAELAAVLPGDGSSQARSVDVALSRLRQRLRASGVQGLDIQTVRGRGFRLRPGPPQAA